MDSWKTGSFQTFDHTNLFFRYKKPKEISKKVVLVLHRGHEHSGRVTELAEKLNIDDCWYFSFDLRGHGRSDGKRAWAPDFNTWVKDLNTFVSFFCDEFQLNRSDIVIVANSVASVMTTSWILNFAPGIRGCVLGAPAFSINLYVPFALSLLRLGKIFSNNLFVTSYVKSNLLTNDEDQAKKYDNDELITKKIGVNVLITLFDTAKIILDRAKDFETPTLILSAEKDYIVKKNAQVRFFKNISSQTKKFIELKGFKHAIFHEKNMEYMLAETKNFINNCFASPNLFLPSTNVAPRKHTVEEFHNLIDTKSILKKIYYYIYRHLLQTLGKTSQGISLGLKYGFNSGTSLDYIYQNKPRGKYFIGKWIDWIYLNSAGWKGIRVRKQHLKQNILELVKKLEAQNKEIVVLDFASGAARYLYEIKDELNSKMKLILNDNDPESIGKAKFLQDYYSISDTDIQYSTQDVFNWDLTDSNITAPNIIIISGIYELYPSNEQVLNSLKITNQLAAEGAYIIYTGQPWHPQLELIGNTLNDRHNKRWLMRRRIQNEMDQLVQSAGFTKVMTASDNLGIFTVSYGIKNTKNEHMNSQLQ